MYGGYISCISFIGCLFLLSSAFAAPWDDFAYTVSRDGAITITGYSGSGGVVVIPSAKDGKPVERIGQRAFAGDPGLTGIIIPITVTSIEDEAFFRCTVLSSAYFSGNAPLLESDVFTGTAKDFTVYYAAGSIGFTSPIWQGSPAEIIDLEWLAAQILEEDAAELKRLRDMRDSKLRRSTIGREIIILYLLQHSRGRH